MNCARLNRVLDAWLDGELDGETSADLGRHVATCASCSALESERAALTRTLRAAMPYHLASPALRGRIRHALASREPQRRLIRGPSWWQAAGLAACVALLSAIVTYWSTQPAAEDPLREHLVASHVASLAEPRRLIDVESTERHVVKPWFQGKVDFAPAVKDLSDQGFVLLGARVDHVSERQAAAVVYRIRSHVINLFIWRSNATATALDEMRARGFSVATWTEDGLRYAAISDVEPRDLHRFATLVRGR